MYVGKIQSLGKGYWVGIKLDEPQGDSTGTIDGTQYFVAPDKHGIFVRPIELQVGDFPEVDPFSADDEI